MACGAVLLLAAAHMAAASLPTVPLNDGSRMPAVGLGTAGSNYGQADVAKLRQAVGWAVEAGFRLVDTAQVYHNERQVGQGVADVIARGLASREDLFITTKLWNDRHRRDQVVPALRESLQRLGLDYVDLYLIHFPDAEKADGSPDSVDYLETWRGMEEARELGLARSIGVSNFNAEQVDRLVAHARVKPAVNQVEVSPTLTQLPLVAHCQRLGITVMAYSPLGFLVERQTGSAPVALDRAPLDAIAKKYNKTSTQVILRYLIDRGVVPIPKSTNQQRICENIDVFDFQLTDDEIATLNKYNTDKSVFPS